MVRYKMLARDINSAPTQYRTWVVPNTPDLTAQLYTGPKSGNNAFVDITAYTILDNSVIADFNLPLPSVWQQPPATPFDFPGHKVLPGVVSDAQLAVIDGYIYLFGGKISDKIYQASTNNPATWIDTGATLPSPLYNSSLAIVDGYVYLFGGNDGYGSTDTIFSAPVSDPLDWTDTSSTLPANLDSSSLGMADGYLYLFGGNSNGATSTIYTASTSDPLTWSVGGALAAPLFGSTIIQTDGYWYLLGGEISPNNPTDIVYGAAVSTPFSWSDITSMPYKTSYGQFFPMGTDGYYMGPSPGDAGTGFTTILQVPLNNIAAWIDTLQVVPAVLSHSQSAIVVDRFWFFGGSGLSAIFANEQLLKYDYFYPTVLAYADITRTIFQGTDNLNQPFAALGIPYWKTDYTL